MGTYAKSQLKCLSKNYTNTHVHDMYMCICIILAAVQFHDYATQNQQTAKPTSLVLYLRLHTERC